MDAPPLSPTHTRLRALYLATAARYRELAVAKAAYPDLKDGYTKLASAVRAALADSFATWAD